MHNGTMYNLCKLRDKLVCYNPMTPIRFNITIWVGLVIEDPYQKTPEGEGRLYFLNYTVQFKQGHKPLCLAFDACVALNKGRGTPCGDQNWIDTWSNSSNCCQMHCTALHNSTHGLSHQVKPISGGGMGGHSAGNGFVGICKETVKWVFERR